MSKLVTTDVENIEGNPLSAALAINENSQRVVDAVENTLSRDGTGPNQMEAQLDMNGYRIINLGAPVNLNDAVRLRDMVTGEVVIETLPPGGTAGQVLTKQSSTDGDADWEDPTGGGGGGGTVESVVASASIDVDDTDPANPIVSVNADVLADIAAALTAASAAARDLRGASFAGFGPIVVPVSKVVVPIKDDCTITKVIVLALGGTGSCVVDIQKSTYAGYPPVASICGSAKPTISSGIKYEDSTLTGWTTSLLEGDVLQFELQSSTTFSSVFVYLILDPA